MCIKKSRKFYLPTIKDEEPFKSSNYEDLKNKPLIADLDAIEGLFISIEVILLLTLFIVHVNGKNINFINALALIILRQTV
ncbi:hypothetical protein W110_02531 [Staphylococcus aureus DAR3507]|nr:hypothetical protein W110_02531 [Staphylococcus aureus DAR3507]EYN23807.1 hypothetical protein W136_00803 [Staphylococcus aureus DAR3592]